jgi:DNA polymerase
VDFETRSAFDILKGGGWKYSCDPTTSVMCLAVRLPHWPEARLWLPRFRYSWGWQEEEGRDVLDELFVWIARGGLVEAHNAFFEQSVWRNICMERLGWPEVPQGQWRCSAMKASAHSLPRSLGGACEALGLDVQKDGEGRRLMLKLSKPRKPRKSELAAKQMWHDMVAAGDDREAECLEDLRRMGYDPEHDLWWHDDPADLQGLYSYCRTDVDSEHGLSEVLPDPSQLELRIWQMDQRTNLRGVLADVRLAKAALRLVRRVTDQLNAELASILGDPDVRATNRAAIRRWLADRGVHLSDTQGKTLDEWLKKEDFRAEKPHCHRVIQIVREVNRTSTAKYKSCLAMASEADGRMRDLMLYHGASTGRWSGKGLQPHNFPRGDVKDVEQLCDVLLSEDVAYIRALYGEVIKALSDALRGLIVASEGKDLMVADYAAIEARVIAWLAHEEEALDVFRSGKCIYMDMATSIYGYLVHDKKKQADERQMGKQAILGLGFGMGFVTFLLTCRKYDITFTREQARRIVGDRWEELEQYMEFYFFPERKPTCQNPAAMRKVGAGRRNRLTKAGLELKQVVHELILMKHIVDAYRAKYQGVAAMWEAVEAAAVEAVQNPGRLVRSHLGRCAFRVEGRFLKCYLPSGRPLYYCDPRIVYRTPPWGGDDKKPVILFMGVNPVTKQWSVQDTYGGKLVENITQATARDLMAEAMLLADDSLIYDVILSVHDELIAEVEVGIGSVEEFEELMSTTPEWADGCPVKAEGWRGPRYRK